MYPSSVVTRRSQRAAVDNDPAGFWAGTQFRSFKEISLAASGVYVVRMIRPVDVVIRGFTLQVNSGELRCEVYRGATFSGAWADVLPVISKNEFSDRPAPAYSAQSSLTGGGAITGGTLFDLIHVKTAGASGQASTASAANENLVSAPAGTTGGYRFSNPGNGAAVGILSIWWEELPTK